MQTIDDTASPQTHPLSDAHLPENTAMTCRAAADQHHENTGENKKNEWKHNLHRGFGGATPRPVGDGVRIESDWTRKAAEMLDPNFSAWITTAASLARRRRRS